MTVTRRVFVAGMGLTIATLSKAQASQIMSSLLPTEAQVRTLADGRPLLLVWRVMGNDDDKRLAMVVSIEGSLYSMAMDIPSYEPACGDTDNLSGLQDLEMLMCSMMFTGFSEIVREKRDAIAKDLVSQLPVEVRDAYPNLAVTSGRHLHEQMAKVCVKDPRPEKQSGYRDWLQREQTH